MSSERARERDVHRYYQTWLESSCGYNYDSTVSPDTRHHRDGTTLRPSNDKALIAFAQLGCVRLQARRCVVTLISSTRQYILAEATKSLSLESGFPEDDEGDELWFGNASLPRSQGISYAALEAPPYTATDQKGRQHTAAALVIPDICYHEDFKHLKYAGHGINFYCGVPIVSKSGFHIGAFTITDDKPRDGICYSELLFMQEMARIVMAHLEVVFNDAARYRGEKLVIGLGNFLEGRQTMQTKRVKEQHISREGNPDLTHEDMTRQFKGMAITNADPSLLGRFESSQSQNEGSLSNLAESHAHTPIDQAGRVHDVDEVHEATQTMSSADSAAEASPREPTNPLQKVFGRAANILRQCTSADGVIFFDATSTNATRRSGTTEYQSATDSGGDGSATGHTTADDHSTSSTESDVSVGRKERSQPSTQKCRALGYALDVSAASTANTSTMKHLAITERVLRRFVRRYPRGKVFYFTASGEISASEGDTSEHTESSDGGAIRFRAQNGAAAITERLIANELILAMPGARNIVWLPLWDYAKQRWSAGTFLWSRRPERLIAAQDDLTYLKTFGNSIMIDVARLDAQSADKAKATFIANISHELRSPLHGILGSVEFLQDTALDGFQSSMTRAVETCAKTLLDTVEHVLDYSKINQMSNKIPRKTRRRLKRSNSAGFNRPSNLSASLVSEVDLASVLEEAVEAVYAGQTFKAAVGRRHNADSMVTDFDAAVKNSLSAKTDTDLSAISGGVRLVFEIDKCNHWRVRTQPGAIRRIVMNIVGNALKYTTEGSIAISMKGKDEYHHGETYRVVQIKVKDTGRGMSNDFLRNHAFTPFSQESYLSTGTGLGLSIVRQIVSSLGGRIELDSEQNVGTEVIIHFKLPLVTSSSDSGSHDGILQAVATRTPGLTMCILNPDDEGHQSGAASKDDSLRKALVDTSKTWFGLKTTEAATMEGQSPDFFIYPEPPPIWYLLKHHRQTGTQKETPLIIMTINAFESASLAANGIDQLTELGRIIEIISQPCGPHKLARALQRAFARLDDVNHSPGPANPQSPIDSRVIEHAGQTSQHATGPLLRGPHDGEHQTSSSDDKAQESRPRTQTPTPTTQTSGASIVRPTVKRRSTASSLTSGSDSQKSSPSVITPMPQTTPISPTTKSKLAPVLLVDDNPVNLQLLVAFVRKTGNPYATADDGLKATRLFESAMPDKQYHQQSLSEDEGDDYFAGTSQSPMALTVDEATPTNNTSAVPRQAQPLPLTGPFKYIVMDISMPVMDGIEATRRIRAMERSRGIRQGDKASATIIALTGLGVETTRNEMLDAGADWYLCKPVKFKELRGLFNDEAGGKG